MDLSRPSHPSHRLFLLAILALSALVAQAESCPRPTCDPISQTAYDNLYRQLGSPDNLVSFWVDYKRGPQEHAYYDDKESNAYLYRRQQELKRLETWARKLPDWLDVQAYLGALDGYQVGLDEATREFHTHANLNEMNAYAQEQARCREAERELAKKHKVPVPPEER